MRRAARFRRRLVTVLLVGYTAFVLVVTLSPRMPGESRLLQLVTRALDELHERGWLEGVGVAHVEFVANVLMFVPLGLLVALLIPRSAWWTLLGLGAAFSACIETVQGLFLDARVADWRDVVANGVGFVVGALVAVVFRMLVSHRDRLVALDRAAAASADRAVASERS